MAWASAATIGSVNDKVAGTAISLAGLSQAVGAGDVVVVVVAKDNAATTDGNTNEITSVTDSKSNTYTKAREFCNSQAAGDAGATVAVYYSVLTTALATGDNITANFSDSRTASAMSVWRFTFGAGSTVSVETAGDRADDGADPGAITLTPASAEYLFFRGIAGESNSTVQLTPTTNYTVITNNQTTGGAAATNTGVRGEFSIVTSSSETSDPTWAAIDSASVFVALKEVASSTNLEPLGFQPRIPGALSVGGPPVLRQQEFAYQAAGADVTLLPAVATATADGLTPTLVVMLLPAEADATAVGNVPTVVLTVAPVVADATASGLVPTVQVTVLPDIATATANALVPNLAIIFLEPVAAMPRVRWPRSIGGPPLLAQQPMPATSVVAGDITILPPAALASAAGLVPTLVVTLLPTQATATAAAATPIIQASVLPAIAASTAAGLIPMLQVTVLPATANATATGLVPNIAIDIRILAPVAAATALAMPPTIIIGTVAGPVRDPQANLTGALAEAGLLGAEGKAVLTEEEGKAGLD